MRTDGTATAKERAMSKTRFSEAEILSALEEAAAGISVKDVLREHRISATTFYSWRSRYGTLSAAEIRYLRQLERENGRLRRQAANLHKNKARLERALTEQLSSS